MGGGASSSRSNTGLPADLQPLRENLNSYFINQLQQPGFGQNPTGAIGGIYQNLFGDDPSQDFLGARQALENSLSGDYGSYANQAFQTMMPTIQDAMNTSNRNLSNQYGAQGLRFGTDLMNAQGAAGSNILNNALAQAGQQGMAFMGQQGQQAQTMFDLIGRLGAASIAQTLPLLAQYASSGQEGSSSSSSFQVSI